MISFTYEILGTLAIKANSRKKGFTVEIRRGNCLAVFVQKYKETDGSYAYNLYNFFIDEDHIKRFLKNGGKLLPDVKEVKLNMKYKESATLLKYFAKEHNVICYYK